MILKSVWFSVGDTLWLRNSYPWAVASYSLLAAVPWNELERSHRKQGYMFILTDFKKWCFDCSFLTSISVPTIIVRLGKVEIFNKFNSETFCLLGLSNLRWSNGSWLTEQTNFVLGLISLDCRLIEYFFLNLSNNYWMSMISWIIKTVPRSVLSAEAEGWGR